MPLIIGAALVLGLDSYKQYLLRRRGVTTQGKVLSWKKKHLRNGLFYEPTVTFTTVSLPHVVHTGKGPLQRDDEKTRVVVRYDPYDRHNFTFEEASSVPHTGLVFPAMLLFIVALILPFIVWIWI